MMKCRWCSRVKGMEWKEVVGMRKSQRIYVERIYIRRGWRYLREWGEGALEEGG